MQTIPFPSDILAAGRFDEQARRMGLDPRDRWVGGYVDYEWTRLRPILASYGIDLRDQRVLEFGCNFGASAIIAALLGANVVGVDVSAAAVTLARHNAARYCLPDITLLHLRDTRELPFADAEFDFILCNSVLEYVSPEQLDGIIRELHRILRPGGRLFVTGTSNRLAPKEVHSGQWLVNYLPRLFDSWFQRPPQRGLGPIAFRRAIRGRFSDQDAEDRGDKWLKARAAARGASRPSMPFRFLARLARFVSIGPGWLAPNLSVMLCRLS